MREANSKHSIEFIHKIIRSKMNQSTKPMNHKIYMNSMRRKKMNLPKKNKGGKKIY